MVSDTSRIRSVNCFVSFQETNIIFFLFKMNNKYSEKIINNNSSEESRKLIIFNSDHIWDDVTSQLHKATGYDNIHCEQIAVIAHTKGKAVVKSGELDELEKINSVLKEINLVTSIE